MGTPSPQKIPASIAQATREDLERLLVNSLQKLKARDKRIDELSKQIEQSRLAGDHEDQKRPQDESIELQQLRRTITELENKLLAKEEAFSERLAAETELLRGDLLNMGDLLKEAESSLQKERANVALLEERLSERNERARRTEATLQDNVAELDAEVLRLRDKATEADQAASERSVEVAEARHLASSLEAEVWELREELATLRDTIRQDKGNAKAEEEHEEGSTQEEVGNVMEDQSNGNAATKSTYEPPSPGSKDLSAAQVAAAAAHAELGRTKVEIAALQDALEQARKEAGEASELRARVAELERNLSEPKGTSVPTVVDKDDHKEDNLSDGINEMKEKIEVLEAELSISRTKEADAAEALEKAHHEIDEAQKRESKIRQEISNELNVKIKVLEDQLATVVAEKNKSVNETGDGRHVDGEREKELLESAEAAKREVAQIRKEVDAERSRFKKVLAEFKRRLDASQREKDEAVAALRASEVAAQSAESAKLAAEQELENARRAADTALNELKEYKARAHALLKSKETEVRQAKEVALEEYAAALEAAEEEVKVAEASAARTKLELEAVKRRAAEDLAKTRADMESHISRLESEATSANDAAAAANRQYEHLKLRFESLEERSRGLQSRLAEFEAAQAASSVIQEELETLRAKLQADAEMHATQLREKEAEVISSKEAHDALAAEVSALQRLLRSRKESSQTRSSEPLASWSDENAERHGEAEGWMPGRETGDLSGEAAVVTLERHGSNVGSHASHSIDDSAWIHEMSRKDRELALALRRLAQSEAEVAELERDLELRGAQELALKEAVRDLQREIERLKLPEKAIDIEYLKNILVRLFETGAEESLLPAVAKLLQFSPDEVNRCRVAMETRRMSSSTATMVTDGATQMTSYISDWLGLGGKNRTPLQ